MPRIALINAVCACVRKHIWKYFTLSSKNQVKIFTFDRMTLRIAYQPTLNKRLIL